MTSICRHIHTNGERCGSPALRTLNYCYYHRSLRRSHPSLSREAREPVVIHTRNPGGEPTQFVIPPSPRLDLPALEDRESIQVALSVIIGALARNELDPKRATTLLYGLQVASANAGNLDNRPSRDYLVTETTVDAAGEELAPDEDPPAEIKRLRLMQDLDEDDEEDDDYGDEADEDEDEGLDI